MKDTMNEPKNEKSIATLISELTTEMNTLFRQEINLLKTELSEKVGQSQSGATKLVIGGAVTYAGLLFVLGAITLGLSLFIAHWLAALIVGAVVLVIGVSMISSGKSMLQANNLMPRKTMHQLEKDKEVATEHVAGKTSVK